MKIRKEGRKLIALFLGLMLLLLPFAFSFPTQAEDNSPKSDIIPAAGQTPVTPGSGNELPQTPDTNLNSTNGNSETPASNLVQPVTPGTLEKNLEP